MIRALIPVVLLAAASLFILCCSPAKGSPMDKEINNYKEIEYTDVGVVDGDVIIKFVDGDVTCYINASWNNMACVR